MKINLGCGEHKLDGYENWDCKTGQEAHPLSHIGDDGSRLIIQDCSLEEIRASHVLEHFSHRQTSEVVNHWVAKLMPGGCLKIAVPDFEWIAKHYLDGEPINVQGYTMGAHKDRDDRHGGIFDRESLTEV